MKIAWSVKLPKGAKLKIKDGHGIDEGEVVYEYHQNVVERLPLVGWQNLNSGSRKTILQNIVKKEITKGEIIGKTGFFSNVVLKSPGSGRCLGIDEFGNLELESLIDEIYKAPIASKKVRVEEDKIVFELIGMEFEAEGLNQLKVWGDFDGLIVDDPGKITSLGAKQIIVITDSLEAAIKAEAVGAAGLILVEVDVLKNLEDSDIPIVLMKPEVMLEFKKFIGEKEVKIWLNANAGKVVVVLE